MTYIVDFTFLVVAIFSNGYSSVRGIVFGVIVYVLSLAIALSPIGEWILRLQTGCKPIKRQEYIEQIQ